MIKPKIFSLEWWLDIKCMADNSKSIIEERRWEGRFGVRVSKDKLALKWCRYDDISRYIDKRIVRDYSDARRDKNIAEKLLSEKIEVEFQTPKTTKL